MAKEPMKIAVTGAAGQINYSLLFRITSGEMFGHETPIALTLLEIPQGMKALEGVHMELQDCAYPLLKEVTLTDSVEKGFDGVDLALLIGAKPRGPGMERKDLLQENAKHFVAQAQAINKGGHKGTKIFVVGNPCNTNCLVTLHNAPDIPRDNFYAMTRLDYNRAVYQLSKRAGSNFEAVKDVCIWGNHSATQVPDFCNANIDGAKVREAINDDAWLEGEFVTTIQKRGAAIIEARGKSSAASAAKAIIDSVQSIYAESGNYTAGVYSKGNPYGIDEDLIFSFPLEAAPKGHNIRRGFIWDAFLEEKIALTEKELKEERDMVADLLRS